MKEYPFPATSGSDSPAIKAIPFFQSVSTEDLERLLARTTIIECEPGERIISEGEFDQSLYFLLRGRLRIMKDGSSVAAAWESGEMFGEMALMHNAARTASLVAESKVSCLKVDSQFIESLPEQERAAYMIALYRYVALTATERLASTTEKLAHCEKELEECRHQLNAGGGS